MQLALSRLHLNLARVRRRPAAPRWGHCSAHRRGNGRRVVRPCSPPHASRLFHFRQGQHANFLKVIRRVLTADRCRAAAHSQPGHTAAAMSAIADRRSRVLFRYLRLALFETNPRQSEEKRTRGNGTVGRQPTRHCVGGTRASAREKVEGKSTFPFLRLFPVTTAMRSLPHTGVMAWRAVRPTNARALPSNST